MGFRRSTFAARDNSSAESEDFGGAGGHGQTCMDGSGHKARQRGCALPTTSDSQEQDEAERKPQARRSAGGGSVRIFLSSGIGPLTTGPDRTRP